MSLIKYILFIFNAIFVILGLVLVVTGVMGITGHLVSGISAVTSAASNGEAPDINDLVDSSSIKTLSIAILVIGIIVFFVAFLGCCGAINESNLKVMIVSSPKIIINGIQRLSQHTSHPISFFRFQIPITSPYIRIELSALNISKRIDICNSSIPF